MMENRYKDVGRPLIRLTEECAEVIHIICKAERFGLDNWHPSDPLEITNRDSILREIENARAVMDEVEIYLKEQP